MIEHDFPLIARLTLCALGVVEGGRNRKPYDAVAAWFLRHHPALLPEDQAAAALATIRARTSLVDRMVDDEVTRARSKGEKLCLWIVGGAFDGRWERMDASFQGVVEEIREVDEPAVLKFKDKVLAKSPFAPLWAKVGQRPKSLEGWTVRPRTGTRALVLLEGLAGRMSPSALRRLLQRLQYEVPDARIVLGLPGRPRDEDDQWTSFRIRNLGYHVEEDTNLGPRGRLLNPVGGELCPGMYPVRLLRMSGKP